MIDTSIVLQPQQSVDSLADAFKKVDLAPKVSISFSSLATVATDVQKGKQTPLSKQYLNLPPAMLTRSSRRRTQQQEMEAPTAEEEQ